jgi:hypothetical protein
MMNDQPPLEERHAALERALIDEFLGRRGHTRPSLTALPAHEAAALLRAAAGYASLRLAEIDSRAHYVDEIHRPS